MSKDCTAYFRIACLVFTVLSLSAIPPALSTSNPHTTQSTSFHPALNNPQRNVLKSKLTEGNAQNTLPLRNSTTQGSWTDPTRQPPVLSRVEVLHPGLETGAMSDTMGFVQTPGFSTGRNYPPNMDSSVRISVPYYHVTLVSLPRMSTHSALPGTADQCDPMQSDIVQLYEKEKSAENLVWRACHVNVPPAAMHEARDLVVHFRSDSEAEQVGFRLLFSFHERSRAPSRDSEGLWNCSGPEWPQFERHFLCDMETECAGGEDELPCFYTGDCGQGYLTLLVRCYVYVPWNVGDPFLSWRDSNLECQERYGGHLASLNTLEEWDAVVSVLDNRRSPFKLYVGLFQAPSVSPRMYKHTLMWADGTVAYFSRTTQMSGANCATIEPRHLQEIVNVDSSCDDRNEAAAFLCETPEETASVVLQKKKKNEFSRIHLVTPAVANETMPFPVVECPDGHLTHAFLACDVNSACWQPRHGDIESEAWGVPSATSCPAPLTSLPAMFACDSGVQRVPYSVVCDHRQQCDDGSDEGFCVFPACVQPTPVRCGLTQQCVPSSAVCDGQADCAQSSDEDQCRVSGSSNSNAAQPPAVVHFNFRENKFQLDITSLYEVKIDKYQTASDGDMMEQPSLCPGTHFQCPGRGYCLPVFTRCNDVLDCPGKEDEASCDQRYTCPGFYRCHGSRSCLHPSHLCDGKYQCPQNDDELLCAMKCPSSCTCHGLAFHCRQPFEAGLYPGLKYLDAARSGMTTGMFRVNVMLIHLGLRECQLDNMANLTLPNLRSLDLGGNRLSAVSLGDLKEIFNLQHLSLAGNPVEMLFSLPGDGEFSGNPGEMIFSSPGHGNLSYPALRILDLSRIPLYQLDTDCLSPFPNLVTLNLSLCGITRVSGVGLLTVPKLEIVDLSGCPLTFMPPDLLLGLTRLQEVNADNFKLCCPVMLPARFNHARCRAPRDQVSSCEALLRSDAYRIFLSMFSIFALVGNLGSFLLRSFRLHDSKSGFGVFVTHLSVSDFLMGVYLAVIGVADRVYQGTYLWKDEAWRSSGACQTAGFLSVLSNEASALIICLITLARFLVLRFPFSHHVHFSRKSAHVACGVAWGVGVAVAGVPLLPATSHWRLYGQTGICIPLAVTRGDSAGHSYAFGVLTQSAET